jgi:hypothetical protein
MATKWLNTLTSKWRKISGALAVLLMFFVPITRAVFANAGGSRNSGHNQGAENKNGVKNNNHDSGGGNWSNHSDRSCASDRTPPTPSSVSRVKPKSDSSGTHGSKSGGKNYNKPKAK